MARPARQEIELLIRNGDCPRVFDSGIVRLRLIEKFAVALDSLRYSENERMGMNTTSDGV